MPEKQASEAGGEEAPAAPPVSDPVAFRAGRLVGRAIGYTVGRTAEFAAGVLVESGALALVGKALGAGLCVAAASIGIPLDLPPTRRKEGEDP